LPGTAVLPAILDDLEIATGARFLGAEKHGVLLEPP